ncbi:DUF2867 domain-containing protein [Fulvivirgaceae bacterium BMA10]|uniref:DUF2867 domain-containing protein n=1 Tax=Splendidivirga corallicola TaxID=3051826 RepID=A0ABT8KPV5_9BACT|nr:DUF2867 domain-containing protein [Fulvivirgaceae bacterium BMA10]
MDVIEVELNKGYLISKQSGAIDYSDVFQMKTKSLNEIPEPKDCMIAFFKSFPPFLIKLLLLREKIARIFGLKTASETSQAEREKTLNEFEGKVGDSIAIFEVIGKDHMELLTGQKDKHLDFKLSFISYEKDNHAIVELATTVNIHNILGRFYFFFVKPIHRLYMKRILRRMEKELINKSW